MSKLTKRMLAIHKKIDLNKQYNIKTAICFLKKSSTVKFNESVDVAINLNIDSRKSEQNIRSSVLLPHGNGRIVRVAVFTQGENIEIAKMAGAERVGMEDLMEHFKKSKIDVNVVIASPDAMHIVNKIGQILGPRGLMPNPKIGTVTLNVAEAIKNAKLGKIFYRNDKNGIIHTSIGKINFETNKLKENLESLLTSLINAKPTQIKGTYVKKINISTTMGISIVVDPISLNVVLN